MSSAPEVVDRLSQAVESGELAALCARAEVELMVLFGSATRTPAAAADVDLAVSFRGGRGDQLRLLEGLYRLTGYEGFDILDLDRAGVVAREHALVGARVLHQATQGDFAERQIAAIMERMDTEEFRRVELDLMT